jgi:hypothetical protein
MESTGATRTVSKIDTSCLVYTSVTAPRSQATSEYFIQYGIHGEIAVPIREVSITATSRTESFAMMLWSHVISTTVQALLYNTAFDIQNGVVFKSVLPAPGKVKDIFSYPEMIVSFGRDNLKEGIQAVMSGLGFRKEAVGRRTYYQGPSSHKTV